MYIPSFKLISQSMLKKSPENADGRTDGRTDGQTDGRTLPRHNTSRFSNGRIKMTLLIYYRNWPRYGLRWSGWYCNPEQHELCRPSRGRHNECCSGLQYQPRQRRPYKWSISILPRSQFTKSKGNLRFRRLVPLFVPIGVCVTTHDDGTASDVTISMWRHNQQVTNHERHGKPWFSHPK